MMQRSAEVVLKGIEGMPSPEVLEPKLRAELEQLRQKLPSEQPAKLAELLIDEVANEIEAKQKGLDSFEKNLLRLPAEVRAKTVLEQLNSAVSQEQKSQLLNRYLDKKIITEKVAQEMGRLAQ